MAFLTLNGAAVSEARVFLPRVGVWYADCVLDFETLAGTGEAELVLGESMALRGTLWRGGLHGGLMHARVVAGKAGLPKLTTPKHYRNVPLRIPVADVLADAGELLSPSSDAALLARTLTNWATIRQQAGTVLHSIARLFLCSWRALTDGTIWLGIETWPSASVEYEVVEQRPGDDHAWLNLERLTLLPGCTLAGRHVSTVQYHVSPSNIRTEVLFEP